MPHRRRWRPARWLGRLAVLVLVSALVAPPASAAPERASGAIPPRSNVPVATLRDGCRGPANSVAVADDLLRNRYHFAPHAMVRLPANPTWAENPLHDENWRFQYHSLRFVLALFQAWADTGDGRYLDRASFLLHDWYVDNPRSHPPSLFSWNDHSTAWRAMVYACAAEVLPAAPWLQAALLLHGRTLASASFYARWGNHALNQDIGLLEVGCRLGRSAWMALAARRVNALIGRSVDSQGATDEQALFYEVYNYRRYSYAARRLRECGQSPSSGFGRIEAMPTFLGYATLPDGTLPMLGDTARKPAPAIAGTIAEFAATAGASGPRPPRTWAIYRAGYAFVRTGWGDARPFADETMLTVRFGPAVTLHGHLDGSSVTLYGFGATVLADPGGFTANAGRWRSFFIGRAAHNLVVVDGLKASRTAATRLAWSRVTGTMLAMATTSRPYAGVSSTRRVAFSRRLGYAIVDDQLSSAGARTYRQLWHLREGSGPVVRGARTWTTSARGNVLIVQVGATPASRVVSGRSAPIQGWISYATNRRVAAPVVEAVRHGRSARFVTLLVPYATELPAVEVTDVSTSAGGFALTVSIDGHHERVIMAGRSSRILPLD